MKKRARELTGYIVHPQGPSQPAANTPTKKHINPPPVSEDPIKSESLLDKTTASNFAVLSYAQNPKIKTTSAKELTRKSTRLKKRVHIFKYVKCHICRNDDCRENLLKCKNISCKQYFCVKCLIRCEPLFKSKKDIDDMRDKWVCMVCSHSCNCPSCISSHNDDIETLRKYVEHDREPNQEKGSILEVDESIFKQSEPTKITEKYGVKIISKGKKKIYSIDNCQLQLEYISNHEFANVTRIRNLYLLQKKAAKPEEPAQTANPPEKKAFKELPPTKAPPIEPPQMAPVNYNQYMQQYPITIMPYTSISINSPYGMGVMPNQAMGKDPRYSAFPQMYYPSNGLVPPPYPYGFPPSYMHQPILYHQNEDYNYYMQNNGYDAKTPQQYEEKKN